MEQRTRTTFFVRQVQHEPPRWRYIHTTHTSKTWLSFGLRSNQPSNRLQPTLPPTAPSSQHIQAGPEPSTPNAPTRRCPMPFLSVTIFAGTVAVALSCVELFTRQPAAITTGMAGSRSRSRARAPPAQRKKHKPKQRWWQIWRKNRRASSGRETGVSEPPQPQPRPTSERRRQLADNRASNSTDPEPLVFTGFSTDMVASQTNFIFCPGASSSTVAPSSRFASQPRLRQQKRKTSKPNLLKKLKSALKSKLKPKKKAEKELVIKPNVESFADEYELIRTFSEISQGAVHLVKHRDSGERFIIKQVFAQHRSDNRLVTEPDEALVLMHCLDTHKNVLRIAGCSPYWEDDVPMYNMVFEYCDAGDVCDYLDRVGCFPIPEQFTLHFVSSMIDALAFLHHGDISYDPATDTTTSIAHRQRSGSQIPSMVYLLSSSVTLGSFDLNGDTRDICSTPGYLAPELEQIKKKSDIVNAQSTEADMYAFGVSLWNVVAQRDYIPGRSNIRQGFEQSSVSQHPGILRLLEACLSPDPARRLKANSLHRLSAQLKSQLQTWYDRGGRLPASLWPNPFGFEQRALKKRPNRGSSLIAIAPKSTTRPRPRVPKRRSELNTWAREMADAYPTIALFPFDVDTSRLMQPTTTTGEPSATAEPLTNLFTGEPADVADADISSTIVEAGNLAADAPISAFSWSSASTDTDDELYI
ncbi:hypothetical protein M409DRAFT_50991 [Zasmidium cellare ATCC 36951]|uniref:Protein kinase domain-containing protein n=1 Tax=Zasmidium cellare ATCC 36951 TaxID=1080233 RepID=A0A6A6CTX9_ZASCE|nr:uncharacterized protein M409DRAFT_50991 [Zasmidium cellare ATCC 36951]KAF2170717.1 hypothetical protein M409DRAFT_50991 [Zasmidium cellare ATCC 36951]